MPDETVSATITIKAPAEAIFAILADPASHPAIDGTGWVRQALDPEHLTAPGQIFRMAMHHDNHPDKDYQMANKVLVCDPPRAISWEPGQDVAGDGNLQFGGWTWRYDLTPVSQSETEVRLSYDWSAVPQFLREHIQFALWQRMLRAYNRATGTGLPCEICCHRRSTGLSTDGRAGSPGRGSTGSIPGRSALVSSRAGSPARQTVRLRSAMTTSSRTGTRAGRRSRRSFRTARSSSGSAA